MPSIVDICNRALLKIGAQPVASLGDASEAARRCAVAYPAARDEVLTLRPWPSATKQATLALLSDAPAFEFASAYALPADYLKAIRLGNDQTKPEAYQVQEGRLLTNSAPAYLTYTSNATDTALYEPLLADLISLRMAVDLATALGGNAALGQALRQAFQDGLIRAKTADGMATGETATEFKSFVEARL